MSLLISQRSRKALPAAGIGKGCIRFQKPAEMDFAVLEKRLGHCGVVRRAVLRYGHE